MCRDRLDRSFFARASDVVAPELIGCRLYRRTPEGLVGGVIVETEAYGGPDDSASHAAIYHRSRTTIMATAAGTAYVYRSYGIHACFNVVSKEEGGVGAVLIRAVQPTEGLPLIRTRRGGVADRDLCRGPGRLCAAFAITLADNLTDVVVRDDLWIESVTKRPLVTATPRIGITRAVEVPWRFVWDGSSYASSTRSSIRR